MQQPCWQWEVHQARHCISNSKRFLTSVIHPSNIICQFDSLCTYHCRLTFYQQQLPVITRVHAGSHYCKAQILFDEGAQRSFMTQQLAQDLSIRSCQHQRICISAFGGEAVPSYKWPLYLSKQTIVQRYPYQCWPSQRLYPPCRIWCPFLVYNHYPHLHGLQLAHPVRSGDNFKITLLRNWGRFLLEDRIVCGNGPTAVESKIGYLLSGPLSLPTDTSDIGMLHAGTAADVGTHIDKFWDVEFTGTLPTSKSTTVSDQQLLTAYIDLLVSQGPDGSYIVNFPWKGDHPPSIKSQYLYEMYAITCLQVGSDPWTIESLWWCYIRPSEMRFYWK